MNTTLQDQGQTIRYKGNNNSAGKILKGTLNDAPIKIKVSSIPNKIQNVIFRNYSQAAFGDSKERFYQPSSNMNNHVPGPGVYNAQKKSFHVDSKKGSGTFASSTKLNRLQRSRSHIPGPGSYVVQNKKNIKKIKGKINRSTSESFFHNQSTAMISSQVQFRDLFRQEIDKAKVIPAPGTYEKEYKERQKLKSANVTFKSKLNRFDASVKNIPPVGHYHHQSQNLKPKPKTSKYEKVQQKKQQTLMKQKQKIQKMLLNKQDNQQLGPGAYNPNFMQTKKSFKIKDNMYDRFGKLKSLYTLAQNPNISQKRKDLDPDNILKFSKTMTHIFKSKTKRPQFFIMKEKNDPGKYKNSKSAQKKSHLINFNQKWVGT